MRVLVLVPTELEWRRLAALPAFPRASDGDGDVGVELVGFGPVAAAARSAALFAAHRPTRALLIGIAGRYDAGPNSTGPAPTGPALTGPALTGPASSSAPPALAVRCGAVRLDGVGAGSGPHYRLPSELDLPQWHDHRGAVFEELPLADVGPTLLTVAAAAGDPSDVAGRLARHPGVVGEDMEAFGVALAAREARIPLHVVRGWSNVAGDRDKARWDIDGALAAAWRVAAELLAEWLTEVRP